MATLSSQISPSHGIASRRAAVQPLFLPEFSSTSNATASLRASRQKLALEPAAYSSPAPVQDFFALPDTNNRTPPDAHGAVGPEHLMTTLNTSVRFQHKNGNQIRTVALSAFWAALGGPDPFDPRCLYDPLSQRWIFTVCANRHSTNSSLLIGVSQTPDPTAPWHLYRIAGIAGENTWFDYPSLGFNKDWIVVQALMKSIGQNEFVESRIYVFSKSDLYSGGLGAFKVFTTRDFGEVQSPAATFDPELPVLYLVATPEENGIGTGIRLLCITGPIGSERLVEAGLLQTPDSWNCRPPGPGNFAPQLGSSQRLHLSNASIQNALYKNGSLWFTHHIFLPATGPSRSAVQWWQVHTNSILQRGRIDDSSGNFFYAYPSIAVNQHDDMLIGHSRFSANDYAGAAYSFRFGSDPPNTQRAEHLFKPGEGHYFKTRQTGKNRWGDYSATLTDPADNTSFWTIQTYAAQPVGDPLQDGSGRWGTWWAKVSPPSSAPDLQLKTAISSNPAIVGHNFTFLIEITNHGPAAASNVIVTNSFSESLRILSSSTSQGTCSAFSNYLVCRLGSLPPQGRATITLVVEPLTVSPAFHQARVTAAERDSVPQNNSLLLEFDISPDEDQDHLPDLWETRFGLDPSNPSDASEDADGDGHTNFHEFLAGTDPRNPDSILQFTKIEPRGNHLRISFNTVLGKYYRLERKDNFLRSLWVPIADWIGTGDLAEIEDQNPGTPEKQFYRIRLLP